MATPHEVADGVWMLRTVLVNVFFVRVEPGAWVLVDAGIAGSAASIRKAATELFGRRRREASCSRTGTSTMSAPCAGCSTPGRCRCWRTRSSCPT